MKNNSKIFIAGHNGLVGSAILRKLRREGYDNFILKTSKELDLRNQNAVEEFFGKEKPEYVFLAAAKVGGIIANDKYSAEFIYDNLMIECNIMNSSYKFNVKKLLFLGSSCIYPKFANQPMKEEYLLDGKLEPTNEAYAIAKIAGLKLCQYYNKQYKTNFISTMPTNIYGINDNFDLETSHVFPALIRKFYEAKINDEKEVVIWGTGKPKREFLFADDLADALFFLMQNYTNSEIINIGTGKDVSIEELAIIIKNIIGFKGRLSFDNSKPDGTPRKLLDVSKINNLGWKARTDLEDGIIKTYEWFLENNA